MTEVTPEYEALYTRYRPQQFRQLVGQEVVAESLRKSVESGTVSHAYLFSGPRGTGKTSTARILAKAVNCAEPVNGEPCNKCQSCLDITDSVSLDVVEYDAASNSGVDAIREIISRSSLASPGNRKFIILDECHMLSTSAFNALLKTLEEAPGRTVFILATTDPRRVPETILSRCQKRNFKLVAPDQMTDFLGKIIRHAGLEISDEQIGQVILEGGGSVRDTLTALESAVLMGQTKTSWSHVLIEHMVTADTVQVLSTVAEAVKDGTPPRTLAEELFTVLRECFFVQMNATEALTTPDWGKRVAVANGLGPKRTVKAIELLSDAIVGMQSGGDGRINLEVALARFCALGA